jgi:hypothetical protein
MDPSSTAQDSEASASIFRNVLFLLTLYERRHTAKLDTKILDGEGA